MNLPLYTPKGVYGARKKLIVVIGAGVVGLACARELAMAGREVIILEQADAIEPRQVPGTEVIHAGIYYEPGSLKAKFCVEGKLKCMPI